MYPHPLVYSQKNSHCVTVQAGLKLLALPIAYVGGMLHCAAMGGFRFWIFWGRGEKCRLWSSRPPRPQVHQDQMRWQSDPGHFRTAHVEIFEMAVGLMILMAGGDEKSAMHQQYIHSLP